jgi:hypothetical protein
MQGPSVDARSRAVSLKAATGPAFAEAEGCGAYGFCEMFTF